ncbi:MULTISPECIES: photosystem II cytochrome c-550 [Pseudanabaena]|uniref:Photosystem II extrinsic protein V n=2 Tax=Pseudanabaena TaxID=1152 RepID=L8MY71_9CYAN|nr:MULTISPECIES: photosystem II cytochrome c-550 [Pseudanabaena]ELS32426.1 Cytochrome c-550 [Pseudanabaena biceps PCC 7429]MDG3495348.1 photosystem II cytochrome c-550 [Pseudanabaena catenata USMAC16]
MLKKCISLILATLLFSFQIFVSEASALELDEATRRVPLNDRGDTIVISLKQVKEGKRLFNFACAQCHVGGITKTNQNVGLSPQDLSGALPNRNNIEGLVDYLKNPTTYDGEIEISELHPSLKSADIFPEMRNLTDEDLQSIAGHILLQPKIFGVKWGGGKIYY